MSTLPTDLRAGLGDFNAPIGRFLANPDPVRFLKHEMRVGRVFIGARTPENDCTGGAQRWIITWAESYARFALVQGKYPAIRAMGTLTHPPGVLWTRSRPTFTQLPPALKHAFAGWLCMEFIRAARGETPTTNGA